LKIIKQKNQILTACKNGDILKFDTETGKQLNQFKIDHEDILSIVFSHDGESLYSGSEDGLIKKWSTLSGECTGTYDDHSD